MYYYKIIEDGYIAAIGTSSHQGTNNITKEEYDNLYDLVTHAPQGDEATVYKLKEDLTWEAQEVHYIDPETQKDASPVIEELKSQVDMLTECILEMADIIYA